MSSGASSVRECGNKPFFQPDQEHQRELQALGRVQRHQRDARVFVVLVGIADQRGVVKEFAQRLAAIARVHGRIHQLAQVLDARQRLRRVLLLQQLDVAGTIQQELQQLAGVRGIARRAKAFDARCFGFVIWRSLFSERTLARSRPRPP